MKKKKITIITPVKNDQRNIEKTIKSVLGQSYKKLEYIVVDGRSNDKTLQIIKKFKKRLKYFSRKDKNLWDAINFGIRNSSGEIIGILNSNDIFYKNTLKTVNQYFNHYKLDYLFGAVKKDRVFHKFEPDKLSYRLNIYPSHSCSFFIKKKIHKKIGLYNIKYDYCSDYDLFYKLFKNKEFKGMNTRKNQVFGKFDMQGISSKIPFYKFYYYEMKIRYNNGQNLIYLIFLYPIKILNKIRNLFT
ncbi:glycosyltransferase [Pelagibacterales bacterium SAG-MED39]|nr:glycosyltransferase [Pelagibacterales bacterium SAG-MED39]